MNQISHEGSTIADLEYSCDAFLKMPTNRFNYLKLSFEKSEKVTKMLVIIRNTIIYSSVLVLLMSLIKSVRQPCLIT